MDDLRHFTLAQLKQLVDSMDDKQTQNYITQNLAVVRNIQVELIQKQFRDSTWILPEMRILILKRGSANVTLNMMAQHFEAGELVFLGANGMLQYGKASDDLQAVGVSLSNELFSLAIGNRIPKAFDGRLRDFHMQLEPNDLDFLDRLHLLIYRNTHEEGHSPQVTLQLVSAFLWFIDHLWSRHETVYRQQQSREQRLFHDFIQLVNNNATSQHQVDYYAARLCLSPRYMSTLVKQASGKAAKEWIDNALITRAKILLRHSEKSILEISEELSFPNPSFFSKYFKRLVGTTPLKFRENP